MEADMDEEQLSNKEIDELSHYLSEQEKEDQPTSNSTNGSAQLPVEADPSQSTSQSIYSNDPLTNNTPTLDVVSLEELRQKDFPPNKWIVDRLVPDNGITCISGKPKVGKSFWALYLAICLALGAKFLDEFETQQSAVLFISKEDPQKLIQERIKLLTDNQTLPIYFCTDTKLFLDTDRFMNEVIKIIQDKNIKVIIVDSFRRIFKGEENSSQVIAEVQYRFKILLELGVSIIFIHHHGKEGFFKREAGDKLRGSSDILAMLDCLLIVERKDDLTLKITQAALRSDKPIESFLVKFPTFTDGDTGFKFLDFLESEVEKVDQAKEDILSLLESGIQSQTEIIQKLTPTGKYGSTTVKNAARELLELRKIDYVVQGNKKLYILIDQEVEDKAEGVAEDEK